MKTKIVALALLASISGAAAADLPRAAYSKAPVLAPAYNWTGFYIGAMGGYGWSQSVHSGGLVANTNDLKGGFAGGTVGYNWQAGSQFVFGLEVDAAWSDVKYREAFILGTSLEDRIRSMGSVTGRVGLAADAALFYVKGGYAWADNRVALLDAGGAALFSENRYHSGWTLGGGLEYGFTANWSAKAEYMYSSFSDSNYLSAFAPGGVALGFDIHTAKVGVNYRFGGPVVARN